MYSNKFADCYVVYDGQKIMVGNSAIERVWALKGGMPEPVSIVDRKRGVQWDEDLPEKNDAVPFAFRYNSRTETYMDFRVAGIEAEKDDDLGVGKEHLRICIMLERDNVQVKWELFIYPQLPVIRSRFWIKCDPTYVACESSTAGLTELNTGRRIEEVIDRVTINSLHCRWKTVSIRAVSDSNNNLVSEDHGMLYPGEHSWHMGNVLFLSHTLDENGMLIIKESPYAAEQINYQGGDFFINGKSIYVTGTGIAVPDISGEDFTPAYGSALCLWSGSEQDALKCLKDYNEARHKFNEGTDCFVMSNTWGDRSGASKINEDFVLSEFKAAEDIGISHYQIDAGWQDNMGRGYGGPNSWAIDRKLFPGGTEVLKAAAAGHKLEIGLWFAPFLQDNYSCWEQEADGMINIHKSADITHFKIDGFKIESPQGEENLIKMMRKVVKETDGGAAFNIDITNWKRLGYFGQTQYGTIFLENRYTDWHNYFPHFALRNLWSVSRYFPSYRLQMEFLNVDRNVHLYQDDPLAPHECGIEYAFAITMFANPLAWFEPTCLSEESREILKRIIPVYRRYQAEILSGWVLPIGDEPDGTSWTGFQSITAEDEGYLLIIREKNGSEGHEFKLWNNFTPGRPCNIKFNRILGEDAHVTFDGRQTLHAGLSRPFSYTLYKYCCGQTGE